MVLFLVLYIPYHIADLRFTVCKSTITLLPSKVTINEVSLFYPHRRSPLQVSDHIRHRLCRTHTDKDVYVVFRPTYGIHSVAMGFRRACHVAV